MNTIVLGLGNPILSDDGVGNRVADMLQGEIDDPEVSVTETNAVGLVLLELVAGYERAILIDSVQTRDGRPGDIYRLTPQSFKPTSNLFSPHDVDFISSLELGRKLGMALPEEVVIFAIEVQDVTTFSESLTPQVERAVPKVVQMVLDELRR